MFGSEYADFRTVQPRLAGKGCLVLEKPLMSACFF